MFYNLCINGTDLCINGVNAIINAFISSETIFAKSTKDILTIIVNTTPDD